MENKNKKILITGGCSFSECISSHIDTWPRHLSRYLHNYDHQSTAIGSMGNGLISRRLIAKVIENLKNGIDPKDILVGVIWSGPDRHEIYNNDNFDPFEKNIDGWMINPVAVYPEQEAKWYIINHHWSNNVAVQYYKNYWSQNLHTIYTFEHVLRLQWFLASKKIPYFMSSFTDEVFAENRLNSETKYLYDQIDFDKFLPVTSELTWCKQNIDKFTDKIRHNHPSTSMHKAFTEQIIIPFLQTKRLI
jgi:hypothetical protein